MNANGGAKEGSHDVCDKITDRRIAMQHRKLTCFCQARHERRGGDGWKRAKLCKHKAHRNESEEVRKDM